MTTKETKDEITPGEKWWFTFGSCVNDLHRNCYVVIEGGWGAARIEMMKRYGGAWSHQYESAEEAGVAKFGLREIK